MTKYLLAAVSAIALTGCGSLPMWMGAPPPSISGPNLCAIAKEHCVKVTIQAGTIVVDLPTVEVTGRGGPHWIVWYVETPGYKFANQAGDRPIMFKTDTNGQFDPEDYKRCYGFNNAQWSNDRVFACIDMNSQSGTFRYGIKVTGTPTVDPLDPIIVNN
jgi:hypothetical protein